MSTIAVFEGYKMARRKSRRGGSRRSKFAKAAKSCARAGKKPGTKAFGSCMRKKLKK
jgi:hypothetical protein